MYGESREKGKGTRKKRNAQDYGITAEQFHALLKKAAQPVKIEKQSGLKQS